MNRNLLKRFTTQLMAWAVVAVLCSVASFAQDAGAPTAPSQGQPAAQTQGPRTDGQIEMDVVHALDASTALKNDLITAATIQSEVTLSGTVSSEASKQLAESIASHVAGVTKVHNNLTIGNPKDAQNMQP
ncbi:MAG: BON domain-containing protein, partial [Terracidiphilus sp.]